MKNIGSARTDNGALIRRARLRSGDIVIYEVKENELFILEQGGSDLNKLTLGTTCLAIGFTALSTLLTVNIDVQVVSVAYMTATATGFLVGAFLLLNWYRSRKSVRDVVKQIKDRLKHGGIRELVD